MAMKIDPDTCTACDDCRPICPTKAIKKGKIFYTIDAAVCTECEGENDTPMCQKVCPSDSITYA